MTKLAQEAQKLQKKQDDYQRQILDTLEHILIELREIKLAMKK